MVRPDSPGARLLESLPQRPPTPPRESNHSRLQAESSVFRRVLSDTLGAQTPSTNSPELWGGSSSCTSDKSRKKVGWTENKKSPIKDSPLQNDLRLLPPSSELKPTKSILKPYNGINPVDRRIGVGKLAAPHTYSNFATMLESIVKQLAGEDRSSRIDAYLTLSGVLKASDDIPDPRSLKEKMSLLTQFIQRDMSAKTASGTLDMAIINNALILLAFFVWSPPIAEGLSADFSIYVVEHAIGALKNPIVSKDIVKHLLFIMGRQNFSAKVMNAERVRRLIETLADIEERVKGRSIVLGRLNIYRKLLRQARASMLASIPWVENLLTDMTSNSREVRAPAVALGFEAALLLGNEKNVSRAVMDLFRKDVGETKYAYSCSKRLDLMVQNKQDGDLVPQIWSIVVLFLRYRAHQLEHWEFMVPWMHVIEKCFNSSDHDIKTQANLAWNRLVFAIQPDESTVPAMIKFLGKVLNLQLKRKLIGKSAKEARQVTIGSVCNLLYYTLNPNAPTAQLDLYWDEYMINLIGKTLVAQEQVNSETEEEDLAHACDVMVALLDISPKTWTKNRATETAIVKADELPRIDPKWVRKNAQRVFNVLGLVVQKCFKNLLKWESSVELLWSRFVASVGAAGAKEVKVSNDTMSSMACVFTLLYKIWEAGPNNLSGHETNSYPSFQKVFTVLVTMTITNLGVLPFTERLLAIGPQTNFAIVATPSHHPVKPRGEMKCPLHHLFVLLTRPCPTLNCDERYLEMVKTILEPFFDDRKTRRSRVELAKDLCQLLPQIASYSPVPVVLWRVLAGFLMTSFDLKSTSGTSSTSSGSFDQPLGSEYRNLARFLEHGIFLSPRTPLPDWKELFTATLTQVTAEAGPDGRAISIIEPLSRVLDDRVAQKDQVPNLSYCTTLVSNASYPADKQAVEATKRRLWGISNPSTKSSSFDPYSYFYVHMVSCLRQSYDSFSTDVTVDASELLSSVSNFIHDCPKFHVIGLLVNIQDGLASWVRDEALRFGGRKSSMLAGSVATLWSNTCEAITRLPHADSTLLRSLETLLSAGFESRHKRIVSDTITLWNSTFGNESSLEYAPRITEAILRIRPVADMRLPSFPDHDGNETNSIPPTFEDESQEDMFPYDTIDYNMLRSSTSRERTPHLEPSPLPQEARRASPNMLVELPHSGSRKRAFQGTPENGKRKVAKKILTPRLRHNNSQVQFAAIDSSPLADAVLDSQLLTDRQREVKERQRDTGSMFANIVAIPCLRTKPGLSTSAPNFNSPVLKQSSIGDPSTPDIVVLGKPSFEEYITSSPTPRRGSLGVQIDTDLTDPSSSPPEMSLTVATPMALVSETARKGTERSKIGTWDVTSSAPTKLQGTPRSSTDLGPSAQVVEDLDFTVADLDTSMVRSSTQTNLLKDAWERPSTPEETYDSLAIERQASRTPNEVFVDALSSPAPPTPIKDANSSQRYLDGMEDNQMVLASDLTQQNDSPFTYSLSEADEDSMLRLITKFDKSESRHDHPNMEDAAGHEDLMLRSPQGGTADSSAESVDLRTTNLPLSTTLEQPNSQRVANLSEKLERRSTISKRQEIKKRTKRLPRTSSPTSVTNSTPVFDSNITPPPTEAPLVVEKDIESSKWANSQVEIRTHLQEKDKNKRTRRSITTKRRIFDELAEIPNSLETNAIRSATKADEIRMSPQSSFYQVENDVSIVKEAKRRISMVHERQRPAAAGDFFIDHNSMVIVPDNEIHKDDVSIILARKPDGEMISQGIADPNNMTAGLNDPHVELGSPHEGKEGETGSKVVSRFENILASLRAVALTREEAQRVENLLWDVKGELYAAERRGRVGV